MNVSAKAPAPALVAPKDGARMSFIVINWSELRNPSVLLRVLAVVAAVVGAIVYFGFAVIHSYPDLAQKEKRLEDRVDHMPQDIQTQFDKAGAETRSQFDKVNTSISGLRTNVMLLCSEVSRGHLPKVCSASAIVAEAKSVSRTQVDAIGLRVTGITLTGEKPVVKSEAVLTSLPHVDWNALSPPQNAGMASALGTPAVDKPEMTNLMVWSSAADSARWHREGRTLRADFTNGGVVYMMKSNVSEAEATEAVDTLNNVAQAFKETKAAELNKKE